MSILLLGLDQEKIPDDYLRRIRALVPGMQVVISRRKEEILPILPDIEIAAGDFPIDWIPQAKNLHWLQQWGAGTDWLMEYVEIAEMDFILTNASGVHAIPISEHILALMLALARNLHQAIKDQVKHEWNRNGEPTELAGKTALVVGLGAIGRQTAIITSALGMRIIGLRRNPNEKVQGTEKVVGPDKLYDVLPEADYVILTMPLTHETKHMFNAQAFQHMRSTAYLINIGRGGTVDEPALIEALKNGSIAGAGLDVFETEPLPPDSPLWDLENVIITPHYSGWTPHYDERAFQIFFDNLQSYVSGSPLHNVVDKSLGY